MSLHLEDYYEEADGTDWLPAMNRAITASAANRDEEILLPPEKLRFSGAVTFTRGTVLIGTGNVGSNLDCGTVLQADFDTDDFLTWSGATSYKGTGGGLRNLKIAAAMSRLPGDAIKITGSGPSNRAGYMDFERVFLYVGSDAGTFGTGFNMDGQAITTPGSAGVRDIFMRNVNIAGCRDYAMEIRNVVHLFCNGVQTIPSAGRGDVVIANASTDVVFIGSIWGTLTLGECSELLIAGRVGALTRGSQCTECRILTGNDMSTAS